MPRYEAIDPECSIDQALTVVGDRWALLVLRDIAGGRHRFDELQAELGVSRKVLAERLRVLVVDGVLERRRYQQRPERFEYHLTASGTDLLPVLVALQTWGARHVLGDGRLSAATPPRSPEARRVRALVGTTLPPLALPDATAHDRDPVGATRWTVLYGYPGAYAPDAQLAGDGGYPPRWDAIPGARGCTLESRTFRERYADFAALGATVHGVSTQRPDQLAAFARHERLPFPLLSDADLRLTAALRLPTFSAAGQQRLKRVTLVLDDERTVRAVRYPVPDPQASVDDALHVVERLAAGPTGIR